MSILLDFLDMREVALEVLLALGPLLVFFAVLQAVFIKLPRELLIRMGLGVLLAGLGLVFFLQGVKKGFLPAGTALGEALGRGNPWALPPIGFLLGFAATFAEPAVRVLSYEVEKASVGAIKQRVTLLVLSFGVAAFVALGMLRIILGIPIHYLIVPGYLLALVLMRFTHPTFLAIAFDAGGVATGPMTVTFVMALAVGVASALEGRDPVLDGLGLISLVALAPILSVMAFGFLHTRSGGNGHSMGDTEHDHEA
ncbi:DUF1538 domain-containing protein [Desulfocurvibacter africanus]|uniref:DUF1538 domain-containing protein n=1 Tax=Desulfocurvibacter africanus subsp. africanus str. Walvis Bay TaxID=690850 RepID=F3YXR2_DESAF|nr:DUF1538 domain-containing protein [Desulfocurvibacter africanus]EGJ49506.1 protein of unknown function DUF1538 [Desulfocurvibacter africanus subsp. africanus str. Walvis Bay]